MGRPSTITEPMVEAARELVRRAESARELRTGLSVTLPHKEQAIRNRIKQAKLWLR